MTAETKHRFGPDGAFLVREPTFSDRLGIEGRIQQATIPHGVMFEFMPDGLKNLTLGIATLETCLEEAPDSWWTELPSVKGEKPRKVIRIIGDSLKESEIEAVIEEVRPLLESFWTTALSRK